MQWPLSNQTQDRLFFSLIIGLILLRVLMTKAIPCPADFDCNSYIKMMDDLRYDPTIAGHHAMRILPALLAKCLYQLGLSVQSAFQVLSGSLYILFGGLTFCLLRHLKVQAMLALGVTLLCLAPHHAMRIPLKLVYQSCDMMTYPLSLLILFCSFKKAYRWIFALSLIGILVRQNLYILGVLSLLYSFFHNRRIENALYIVVLSCFYFGLQFYYHATSTFVALLSPGSDFFTLSHLAWVTIDSKLLELIVPIIPLLILYFKPMVLFLIRYWYIGLYMAITVGQPFLGYHLTGNNFPRLALQGVWILYFMIGLMTIKDHWSSALSWVFVIYAMSIYFSWGMTQRFTYMLIFSALMICLRKTSDDHSLPTHNKRSVFQTNS